MARIPKASGKNRKNTNLVDAKTAQGQALVNSISTNVLACIICNPGIGALMISKKTKIPQSSVYRILRNLVEAGFLDTLHRKPGRSGGNSTITYTSKARRFQIAIDSQGIRVY